MTTIWEVGLPTGPGADWSAGPGAPSTHPRRSRKHEQAPEVDNVPNKDYPSREKCTRLASLPYKRKASVPDASRRTWRFETTESPEREVYLLLQHVSGELIHELATLLKPSGITPEQYHVLRILRDAGSAGVPLSAIAERSPVGDPDVTGLLDRLERRGLAGRAREAPDRRIVTARITKDGRQLLDRLAVPVQALHARQLGPLGERGLQSLRKLLREAASVGPVI